MEISFIPFSIPGISAICFQPPNPIWQDSGQINPENRETGLHIPAQSAHILFWGQMRLKVPGPLTGAFSGSEPVGSRRHTGSPDPATGFFTEG